jgi:hypothetical protein
MPIKGKGKIKGNMTNKPMWVPQLLLLLPMLMLLSLPLQKNNPV